MLRLHYVSQVGGLIRSKQGFHIETEKLEHLLPHSVLLVVWRARNSSVSKR